MADNENPAQAVVRASRAAAKQEQRKKEVAEFREKFAALVAEHDITIQSVRTSRIDGNGTEKIVETLEFF